MKNPLITNVKKPAYHKREKRGINACGELSCYVEPFCQEVNVNVH